MNTEISENFHQVVSDIPAVETILTTASSEDTTAVRLAKIQFNQECKNALDESLNYLNTNDRIKTFFKHFKDLDLGVLNTLFLRFEAGKPICPVKDPEKIMYGSVPAVLNLMDDDFKKSKLNSFHALAYKTDYDPKAIYSWSYITLKKLYVMVLCNWIEEASKDIVDANEKIQYEAKLVIYICKRLSSAATGKYKVPEPLKRSNVVPVIPFG
jgi:hypothetical protein